MKNWSARVRALAGLSISSLAAWAPDAWSQTQSLAFTGGILVNPEVSFRRLGGSPGPGLAGPAGGGAVNRTYIDGYNRIDATGNADGTTANWGYQNADQLRGGSIVMTAVTGSGTGRIDDAGDDIVPSANLEYRGSLGPVGKSDWGIVLGIGYQPIDADARGTFRTGTSFILDQYSLLGADPDSLPPAPYSGTAESEGPRIGSVPTRSFLTVEDNRLVNGRWEVDAMLLPITAGVYFETQIAGRLNGVASAGVLAVVVNSELSYSETSMIDGMPTTTASGSSDENDVIFGGFVQLGLDWALWERASLVASARWQPTESFSQRAAGREVEMDFTTAFAVHAGLSFRF